MAFRHELIKLSTGFISTGWKNLGLSEPCPYPVPTSNELAVHEREYKAFLVEQELKQRFAYLLNTDSDGWVPTEEWEATESSHKQAVDIWTQTVRDTESTDDEEMSKEDLLKIWPFDME